MWLIHLVSDVLGTRLGVEDRIGVRTDSWNRAVRLLKNVHLVG